jgi:quinol monooxygenase YgiN
MAHVTLFRFKALPGKRQALLDQFEKWEREQKSRAAGFQQTILVASNNDPNEFMGAVRWDNTANYMKNANRPEQDAWFRELRSNLASDPEWFDGTLERESKA